MFFSPIFIIIFVILSLYIIIYIISKIECSGYKINTFGIQNNKNNSSFSLLFLSDFHDKIYPNNNLDLINDIIKINPDYIVLGGDFVVFTTFQNFINNSKYKNAIKFIDNLSKKIKENTKNINYNLKRIFFGFGNHELRLKLRNDNNKLKGIYDEFIDCLNRNDITILDDCIYELNDDVSISGLSLYKGYYRNIFSKKSKIKNIDTNILNKHFKNLDKNKFNIMLFHKPDYFDDFAEYGFDLVLSGHNHGGLIKLPYIGALFSTDLNFLPKYNYGLYEYNSKKLIVSSGIGEHFVKIRVNNRPELCLIRIHGKDNI